MKLSAAQRDVLETLATKPGSYLKVDWLTHRVNLFEAQGFCLAVRRPTFDRLLKAGWVEADPSRWKSPWVAHYFQITDAGRAAVADQ